MTIECCDTDMYFGLTNVQVMEENTNKGLTRELKDAVSTIKTAILQSQSRAARMISGSQLSLYFGVGLYVSANSREGTWGTDAIDEISEQLHQELPGLRGFSAQSIRNMRMFAEFWQPYLICSPTASKLELSDLRAEIEYDRFALAKWSPLASEINREEFLGISFSHHMEILHKTKNIQEVLFCIHEAVVHQWDKYTLRDVLKAGIPQPGHAAPNNFVQTMSTAQQAMKAIRMFKDAYLGQLYAYLQVLDDKVRKPHENPSIGIVLCKSANQSYAEYAFRDYNKPMGVATYKTMSDMPKAMQQTLPDIEELKKLMDDEL